MKKIIFIGIDPGTHTGIAFYNSWNKTLTLKTCSFWEAINEIETLLYADLSDDIKIIAYIEDNTQNRPVFKKRLDGKNLAMSLKIAQNVGSNKRDCQLWFGFFERMEIEYHKIRPTKRSLTKISKIYFEKITGYKSRSSEHSRDAGMLVFGR